ncbi:hypothetical protein MHO82_06620 [Vibrio sp. Of7-15]|uniref:hypothetical protein n=1 Tax=Vibrio sp. Of7-15 TaxID=2724879 RepID=UPI001EF1A479|nr:hypothetical protein [Vibrio sp. Of7-15]MCG7496529.1 hypothetical protein [Vibrio sp. Of7-15]
MKHNLICCAIAFALVPAALHAEQVQDNKIEQEQPWQLSLGLDYSRNGHNNSHHLADRNLSANASIRYNLNSDTYFTAEVSGLHRYDGKQGDYWNDIWLTAKKKNVWNPTKNIDMSIGSRVLIPISDTSQKTDLNTAIRGDITFSLSLDDLLKNLQLSDSVRLQKNFHKYTTAGHQLLEEYRVSNVLSVDYYKNKWFFSINFVTSTSWDYRGTSHSPKLTHAEEIGYQFHDNFSAAVGMTNSATYYDPDRGPNPLNTLFDLKDPTYYITLNYNY